VTGREKVEAAFSPEGSADTAAVLCYDDIYVRDHWDSLTELPWWYRFSPDLEHQLAWRRDVIAKTPQDWMPLPACPPRAERGASAIEESGQDVFLVNRTTGRRRKLARPVVGGWDPAGVSRHVEPPRLPRTLEEVDALFPPEERCDAQSFVSSGRSDLAAAMLVEWGRDLFPVGYTPSPLWACYSLWGFEGMMLLIGERPDLVRRACDHLLGQSLRGAELGAVLGAQAIWVEECFTDMISPSAYGELSVPVMQRLIEGICSFGMRSIFYYCGDPSGKWSHLLSVGADALSLEEGKKGFHIDVEEVVAKVAGRAVVFGNLDALGVLQNGSDGRLRDEIIRQLAAGRRTGGRFVMSLGSPVTPGTPVARVRLYCDLVHQLGRAESGRRSCPA
jgi:hypothetical protein